MRYDDIKNRLLSYLTDDTQKTRVERAFEKIEVLAPTVPSVRVYMDDKVNSVNDALDFIDSGRIPEKGVPGKLNNVISGLENLPKYTRSREREIVQEVERIKFVASSVFLDYINSAKSNFSINTSSEANRHTRGVQTALATELLLKDLHTIIELADFDCFDLDLRVLYMPYQFIVVYLPYIVEYFKQYNGEMTYD